MLKIVSMEFGEMEIMWYLFWVLLEGERCCSTFAKATVDKVDAAGDVAYATVKSCYRNGEMLLAQRERVQVFQCRNPY